MEDTFDFVVNDEDEVMLLIYNREGKAQDAFIEISPEEKSAILHRNGTDSILLQNIQDDIIDSLQDADTLLVCELSREQNEDDTKIVDAYEADINM